MSDQATLTPPTKKLKTSPWSDPIGLLTSRGWKYLGDPVDPRTLWQDPSEPEVEQQEIRVIGEKKSPDGTREQITQLYVTPAGMPVPRDQAVARVINRENLQVA
jgi:hypothetical protein